jgi:putative hydrolase of the HAD superfamily
MSPVIKAVLFDLDQTLTDRSASISSYAQRFRRDFGWRLSDTSPAAIADAIGVLDALGYAPRRLVFGGLLQMPQWVSMPSIEEIREHWETFFPLCTVGREQLHEVLETLTRRGYRLGIITNGSIRSQRAKVECLAIEKYLTSVVISEEAGIAKPDARVFQVAACEIGVEPCACLFVGDHPLNDVVGASNAGLTSVWLEGVHEWLSDLPLPSRRIQQLSSLLDLPELGGRAAT